MKELIDFFHRHPQLKLTKREAKILSNVSQLKKVKEGETLFSEGDPANELFILKKGSFGIFKKGYLGDIKISTINEGEVFGEMGVIENLPRTANAKSETECELIVIDKEKISLLKEKHPKVGIKLMDLILKTISQRLRTTTKKLL